MFLMNQAENISGDIKRNLYLNSLNKEIAANVRYRQPQTLEEAIQFSSVYEKSFVRKNEKHDQEVNYTRFAKNKYGNQKQLNTQLVCYVCGKQGHKNSECYVVQQLQRHNYKQGNYKGFINLVDNQNNNNYLIIKVKRTIIK